MLFIVTLFRASSYFFANFYFSIAIPEVLCYNEASFINDSRVARVLFEVTHERRIRKDVIKKGNDPP